MGSFAHKDDYPTLTRMMGSYNMLETALIGIFTRFNWRVAALLFINNKPDSNRGHSKCHFILAPIYQALGEKTFHRTFNETADAKEYKRLLLEASKRARSKCCRIFYV